MDLYIRSPPSFHGVVPQRQLLQYLIIPSSKYSRNTGISLVRPNYTATCILTALRNILILSSYLRLGTPNDLFSTDSHIKNLYAFFISTTGAI
jgi:hypothetical protein